MKKPSARPTSCNLSDSSPMTGPITYWASEGLASLMFLQHSPLFPLPADPFPSDPKHSSSFRSNAIVAKRKKVILFPMILITF